MSRSHAADLYLLIDLWRINNRQKTYTAMNENNVVELKAPAGDALGELLKEGARQLLAQAIEADIAELLARHAPRSEYVFARLGGI